MRNGLAVLGGIHSDLGGFHNAGSLQSGDLDHFAAQLTGQLVNVDLVAILLDHVHHVDGHDHRDAQLHQLGGQIQVALQVGTVDDVQNGVGALADQIVPGHHFLQRVGRQGVNTRQVGDGNFGVLLQLALFLFHSNAGPVADELVCTGQRIEQRRLTGVGVAREGNGQLHTCFLSFTASLVSEH